MACKWWRGGRIRLYEARGTLQLYVDSLEPRGLGALRLQLQQLRDKLEAEGLLGAGAQAAAALPAAIAWRS